MCGIVGFVGQGNTKDILLSGLSRLEYRGYDSAGIALYSRPFTVVKAVGKLKELKKKVEMLENLQEKEGEWKYGVDKCKMMGARIFSCARTYTRMQGFCVFAVTSVTVVHVIG